MPLAGKVIGARDTHYASSQDQNLHDVPQSDEFFMMIGDITG
jgi:hypothetical protein